VHPVSECIEIALKRRAFGRALRVTHLETDNLDEWAEKTMDN